MRVVIPSAARTLFDAVHARNRVTAPNGFKQSRKMSDQPANSITTLATWKARASNFMRRTRMTRRRLAILLAVVGPGLITSNVDNDAGGITTYTTSGAQFGYTLLWSLIPMTIALYVSEEMCARMGVVTGKGLSDLIREEFGFRSTFFVMIAALAVDLGNTVAEFAGVAASMQIFGVSNISPCRSQESPCGFS